ncbi:MAG TPA: TRAP transporter substrate-binding protein [Thauera phenylacetica]|jgi:tripartite ATP-independent transporter DctP family solute receptor|uniref:TRAP dicarboxylate transporter subunit DctP n=1 Tax=Thauera phenylacetica B4P TaxID=1234382 RepID=N6ZVJ1_9RHOO|nr:TRAP transporter substrate-binding protein [Thauera phenylacetica]ENO98487.1 TRAP dicarboxylate transporter subunit DctP [Thauera phenylacetica B4P]MBP7639774.1 TRAP transporter substrate-binding protein [Thauera sp.]HRM67965.1 TRAP transporter substrate-binding protein [Thauera phenylacetica]
MKKRMFIKTAMTAAAALAMGVASMGAYAQSFSERTLRLGIQNPKGHPAEVGAQKFADLVGEKTGGKIKVRVFAGGVLGGDQQTVSALQGGTIEMTALNSGILASHVPALGVYDLPFLFNNSDEVDAVVDGPFGQKLHARLEEKGIVALGYWELGFRNLTNNVRPINKVEDIAGLKLRVIPNPINLDWVQALGANPVALAFPEVFNALEQRAVDGQENPVTVILANKFAEVQKHLALTRHQYNPQSMIISKKVWDTFSADEKKVFQDAAKEAIAHQRKVSREQSETALEALKKAGMQVTELPPEEVAKLREKMKPVIEKHSATVGADVVTELQAELAKLRTK